jgi:signal transduction histidine kinase
MSPVPVAPTTTRSAPARAAAGALAEVEAERAALSRLLHDDVMQTLLAARYAADIAGDATVREAVREAIAEASAAMWRLRPRTTEGLLLRALGELADRRSGIVLALHIDGLPDVLDASAATVAFRVVQAAMEACRGSAMTCRVELRAGVLSVSVCDDGPAYDNAVNAPDSDLFRWLARAGALGGRARVGDGPSGGTTLWLEIPDALPKENDAP